MITTCQLRMLTRQPFGCTCLLYFLYIQGDFWVYLALCKNTNFFIKWQHFIRFGGGNGQYNSPAFSCFVHKKHNRSLHVWTVKFYRVLWKQNSYLVMRQASLDLLPNFFRSEGIWLLSVLIYVLGGARDVGLTCRCSGCSCWCNSILITLKAWSPTGLSFRQTKITVRHHKWI